MKHLSIAALFLSFFIFSSCDNSNIVKPSSDTYEKSSEITYSKKAKLKKNFAEKLALALHEHKSLRLLLKNEALRKINKDFDILYQLIKNKKLSNGKTVHAILENYFENESHLLRIESELPLLTIFVPELPENTFSAKDWDIEKQKPLVAIRLSNTNSVPVFGINNEEFVLSPTDIPAFPVVVIKENERIILNNNSKGNNLKSKSHIPNGVKINSRYRFVDKIYNGLIKNNSKVNDRSKISSRDRGGRGDRDTRDPNYPPLYDPPLALDSKHAEAYDVYRNNSGWQRDFIYYNIKPSQERGSLSSDYQEYIRGIKFEGDDPRQILGKLADQVSDPELKDGKYDSQSSGWTDGSFEFKVDIFLSSKEGLSPLTKRFFADPEDLFYMNKVCQTCNERNSGPNYHPTYTTKDIRFKYYILNQPIFTWDLKNYATSIKINIQEVDKEQEVTKTVTRTVNFATNFGIDLSIFKIGLKFGGSAKKTKTQTTKITYSKGNDDLGSVLVNFKDDIIINYDGRLRSRRCGERSRSSSTECGYAGLSLTRDYIRQYSSGIYKIEVVPLKIGTVN